MMITLLRDNIAYKSKGTFSQEIRQSKPLHILVVAFLFFILQGERYLHSTSTFAASKNKNTLTIVYYLSRKVSQIDSDDLLDLEG